MLTKQQKRDAVLARDMDMYLVGGKKNIEGYAQETGQDVTEVRSRRDSGREVLSEYIMALGPSEVAPRLEGSEFTIDEKGWIAGSTAVKTACFRKK